MNSGNALIYHGGGAMKRGFSTAGGGALDEKVKVSGNDTTSDYLINKWSSFNPNAGDALPTVIDSPGGDEDLNVVSQREVTIIFTNRLDDLQVNDSIPMPDFLPVTWCGYFIPFGINFHTIWGLVRCYKTNAATTVNIRFRYYDTSQAAVVDQTSGTILGNLLFNLDNTASVFKYYRGAAVNLQNWGVPGGKMVIPYCQSNGATRVDGINICMRGTINNYAPP